MVAPLHRLKKVKKHQKTFTRFQSDQFMRVKPSWRQPHGIDSRIRRKFRGNKPMPGIGYGTARSTRFLLPNGFRKFLVTNDKDLEVLLMHNRVYCAELAHNLSARSRKRLVERAAQLGVRVTNSNARVRTEERK